MEKRKNIYRKCLVAALCINVIAILFFLFLKIDKTVPDHLKLVVNRKESFHFSVPLQGDMNTENIEVIHEASQKLDPNVIHFDFQKPFTISSSQKGSYVIDLKLFGILPIKQMHVDVIEEKKVIPCGMTIGIQIETDGILVLGTGSIVGKDGLNYEPALNILKSGDYIKAINQVEVNTKEELMKEIQKTNGEAIPITIKRNQQILQVSIKPVETIGGEYKIGSWIRDDTQGIGTLTYVDEENNFGALGHGITDVDTGLLMSISEGEIYRANILQIVKGKVGEPGEIVGYIDKNKNALWGKITNNTEQGIIGKFTKNDVVDKSNIMPIGLKQEIKKGKASILCQMNNRIQNYEIKIEKIELNASNNKGMVIRITDKELLKQTNGIIQGMSGSPIIQNNKVIGAVTHVFVQDSTKGYGTFIENMINIKKN